MKKKRHKPRKENSEVKNAAQGDSNPVCDEPRSLLVRIWNGFKKIYLLIMTVGAIASTSLLYLDIYQKSIPEIHLQESNSTSPFVDVPFTITNNSPIFPMHIVGIDCSPDNIAVSGPGTNARLIGRGHFMDQRDITIGRNGRVDFTCSAIGQSGHNFINFSPKGHVTEDHIFMRVQFKWLWIFTWDSPESEFTWYTNTTMPHWIEGKIIE